MKKVIIFLLVLMSCYGVVAQPVTQRGSATITVVDARSGATFNFFMPRYVDTTQANLSLGIDSCGAIIYTYSQNSAWFRQCSPKKWVLFGSSNGNNNSDTLFAQRPIFFDSTTRPGSTIIKYLNPNGIISGGTVTVDSCKSLDIPPTVVTLNYVQYASAETRLIVPSSDASFDRVDEVIDSLGYIILRTGTPSAIPIGKPIDAATEFILASYTFKAMATCIAINQVIVWDENLGTTAEFAFTTSGTGTSNGNNTDKPQHLTKAIFVSTYTTGYNLIFTYSSPLTASAGEIFKFWTYLNVPFGSNQFVIQFYNGSTAVGTPLAFGSGFGFNPNDSNLYQNINIPLSAFNITNQLFNKIIITFSGNDLSGAGGLYLDYLQLQSGATNTGSGKGVINFTKNATRDSLKLYLEDGTVYTVKDSSGGAASVPTLQQVFNTQVGGSILTKRDTILTQTFALRATGSGATILEVNNTGAGYTISSTSVGNGLSSTITSGGGIAISGDATTGSGVAGSATTGSGLSAITTSGNGVNSVSTTGWPIATFQNPAITNTIGRGVLIQQGTSLTAGNGIGTKIEFDIQAVNGVSAMANQLQSKLTNDTLASRTSEFSIIGVSSAVTNTLLTLSGSGAGKLNQYGIGTFTGTPAFTLQVDASGNIIEGSVGGGGSTNSNIGSGFRLAVPGTNNIKTLLNGYAIGIDSSVSNSLQFKADTSLLLTKLGAAAIYATPYSGTGYAKFSGTTASYVTLIPIADGGTNNASLSVTAGTIYYGDGTKLLGLAPGTSKQHLVGGTTPSWKDTTAAGGGSFINNSRTLQSPAVFNIAGSGLIRDTVYARYGSFGNYVPLIGSRSIVVARDTSTYTAADGDLGFYGFGAFPTISKISGADGDGAMDAMGSEAIIGAGNTANWSSVIGINAFKGSVNIKAGATGIITNAAAYYAGGDMQGTLTIINNNGLHVNNPFVTGTMSITRQYGVYIEQQTVGATNYQIYSEAGTNFFTTNVMTPLVIGGTSTTADLFLKTTSGVGTTGADMHMLVGNNGATEAMTILNNGNVGIGNTNPSVNLNILGAVNSDVGELIRNTTAGTAATTFLSLQSDATTNSIGTQVFSSTYTSAASAIASSGRIATGSTATAGLGFSTLTTAPIKFYTNDVLGMTLLSNNHLLIGTSTDIATLTVTGAASISTSVTSPILYGSSASGGTLTLHGTSNATAATTAPITADNINIVGNPLSGSSVNSNFLTITGTLPTTMSASTYGAYLNFTGAGSSTAFSAGLRVLYNAGYTGSGQIAALSFGNGSASTGNDLKWTTTLATPAGNSGVTGFAYGTTTGLNVAGYMEAVDGSVNVGAFGKATFAKNSATNIGVIGQGNNTGTSPIQIGGYFTLGVAAPTFVSAALIADNATTTSNIFTARDNGTVVFSIPDGGNPTLALGNRLIIGTGTNGSAGDATLVAGTIAVTITGLTTSSRAQVTRTVSANTTLTTGWTAVCTANTLTITADVAAGTINTADTSTFTYFVIN